MPGPVPIPQTSPPAPQQSPLPPPEALIDVMNRLADAETFDRFAAALRDGGFTPVRFTADELRWADSRPGDVIAAITATGPESATTPGPGQFAFPMEFRPHAGGWQLSRGTAEMLLAFGNARSEAPAPR